MTMPAHNAFGKFGSPVGKKDLCVHLSRSVLSTSTAGSIGRLTPELYRNTTSIPNTTFCSTDTANEEGSGKIQFTLEFCKNSHGLKIFVESLSELSASSEKEPSSNPHVEVSLVPARDVRTFRPKNSPEVRSKTANPIYNESFELPMRLRDYSQKMLLINVTVCDEKGKKARILGYYLVKDLEMYCSSSVYAFDEYLYPRKHHVRSRTFNFS